MVVIVRRILLSALLAVLLLGMTAAHLRSPDSTGRLTVTLANGTAGAGAPLGNEVELLAYQDQVLVHTLRESTAIAPARQVFEGLAIGDQWAYVATTNYRGATFATTPVSFAGQGQIGIEIELTVFEATEQDPGLRIANYSVILALEPGGKTLRSVHTITFEVPGDLAFGVPASTGQLRFALPSGARAFNPLSGLASWELAPDGDYLAAGATLIPGDSTISFEYQFPWDRAGQDFAVSAPVAVGQLNLRAVERQVLVASPGIVQLPGLQMNQTTTLGHWQATDIPAGADLSIRLSDPSFGVLDRLVDALDGRTAGAFAVGLGLIGALAASWRRWQGRRVRLAEALAALADPDLRKDNSTASARLGQLLAADPGLARRIRLARKQN